MAENTKREPICVVISRDLDMNCVFELSSGLNHTRLPESPLRLHPLLRSALRAQELLVWRLRWHLPRVCGSSS